jgi:hypothetical protein
VSDIVKVNCTLVGARKGLCVGSYFGEVAVFIVPSIGLAMPISRVLSLTYKFLAQSDA